MKRIIVILVVLSLLYFLIGIIFVLTGTMLEATYLKYAAIVGGCSSVLSLLSFGLPKINVKDFEAEELKTIKQFVKAGEELEVKKHELSLKKEEIEKLVTQKESIEYLVRKVSLSIYYEEQYKLKTEEIAKRIENDTHLKALFEEYIYLKRKLEALNVEINADENAEFVIQILNEVNTEEPKGYSSLLYVLIKNITEIVVGRF